MVKHSTVKHSTVKHNTVVKRRSAMKHNRVSQQRKRVTNTCLVPDCDNDARCRGVCDGCYQSAWKMVRMGEITFEELEAQGLIKPAYQRKNKLAAAIGK